jgi:voltage-gated potassium channel
VAYTGRQRIVGIVLTVAMILLIAFAVTEIAFWLAFVMVAIIAGGVAFVTLVFPGSRFFSISLANLLAVYASIYMLFITTNFVGASEAVVSVAFLLPILGFFGGAWRWRKPIATILGEPEVSEHAGIGHILRWLLPVFAVGATTFALPPLELTPLQTDAMLLLDMAVIAGLVFFASRAVAIFMIATGLMFEEFFVRAGRLAVPAFAFLTFYSLNVIVFAALYRIVERISGTPQFLVANEPATITFSEALYFSLISVATVGYGDITPLGGLVRALASVQIIIGVLLLLFGFYEIMSYARDHLEHEHKRRR